MRESFTFYRSFFESVSVLPLEVQAEIYPALIAYALDDSPPQSLSPIANSIFTLMKPIIDSSNKKRDNALKGGAPKGNQNAKKKTTKNNQKQPAVEIQKQPLNNQKQPNNVNCYNILSSTNVESNNSNINIKDDEIINNSIINNKAVFDDVAVVAEEFFSEISKESFAQQACEALSISRKEFLQHAKAIIAEWKIAGLQNFLPENTPTIHLINQMRIKRDLPEEKKAQSRFCDIVKQQQRKKEEKAQEQQEKAESRGIASLKSFKQANGLKEGECILSLLSRPSEADALADFRALNHM